MAKGKVHDLFNIYIGLFLSSFFILLGMSWPLFMAFNGGWMFSTFIFNPDSDLMPKKRAGPLRLVLYPYCIFFKHRGLSHHWLFGTITRIFYLAVVLIILTYVFHQMGHIEFSARGLMAQTWFFIKSYNYQLFSYQITTWIIVGMFLADLSHIFLDRITSFFKKYFI